MSFEQPDHENTFSEFISLVRDELHWGALIIGLASLALLFFGPHSRLLKRIPLPMPLLVVALGIALAQWFEQLGGMWAVTSDHLVETPVTSSLGDLAAHLQFPDFSRWLDPAVYKAAFTVAIVASLETLLNLEAVDQLDPQRRHSPPSRELIAQGIGNMTVGLIGGLPVTSVVVRGSVNVHSGAQTRLSAIFHGVLLLLSVAFLPQYLNMIPLSCLAAILLATGAKLASPKLFASMWNEGRYQFAPFIITLAAIVFTDLLQGILIGLAVSVAFILNSNVRRPIRQIVEKHIGGDVLKVELPNQVSFLNRAAVEHIFHRLKRGDHVLLDATESDYIDPDILNLIREFRDVAGPAHGVHVSLRGFRRKYQLHDDIRYVDFSTRDLQGQITPSQVLKILADGNERFRSGKLLHHDFDRQRSAAAAGQHPLAVVLSCIDSRAPVELLFDLGLGDVFSVRIAGNVVSPKVLGSIEYGCAVAGSRLLLVLGHTYCGAVTASVKLAGEGKTALESTDCRHLDSIVEEIQKSVDEATAQKFPIANPVEQAAIVDNVAWDNVVRTTRQVVDSSPTIARLVAEGRIAVVGGMYDIATGHTHFLVDQAIGALAWEVET
ncbi:MAG: sulfate transporter, partial [Planctomycetales bacterium]|nr:sulfate transporter [Planctomycetales bacterium]